MPKRTPLEIAQRLREFQDLGPGEYLVVDETEPLTAIPWSDLEGPDVLAAPGPLWAIDLTGAPGWVIDAVLAALRGARDHRPTVLAFRDDGSAGWPELRYMLARGH